MPNSTSQRSVSVSVHGLPRAMVVSFLFPYPKGSSSSKRRSTAKMFCKHGHRHKHIVQHVVNVFNVHADALSTEFGSAKTTLFDTDGRNPFRTTLKPWLKPL